MDSAMIPHGCRICLRFALAAALISQTGCARFNLFHRDKGPAFGTEAVEFSGPSQPVPNGDLYASLMKPRGDSKSAPAVGDPKAPMIADASRSPGDIARRTETKPPTVVVSEPAVALQPPVTLRPLPAEPAAIARRSEPVGPIRLKEPLTSVDPAWVSNPTPASNVPKDAALGTILVSTRKALDALVSYQVAASHQERVGPILNPAEDVVMSIRRKPKAIRLEWPDGPNKGREVIYAADRGNGQMHVRMPNPLMPRISMAPDGPLAVRSSRHPITEAGYDTIVEGMEKAFAAQQKGDRSYGEMRYAGLQTPPGSTKPCQRIVRVSPAKETWEVYLDPATHLPLYVVAKMANGDLLERHVFGTPKVNPPALASADAFDADARWGEAKSLLSRLSGAALAPEKETRAR